MTDEREIFHVNRTWKTEYRSALVGQIKEGTLNFACLSVGLCVRKMPGCVSSPSWISVEQGQFLLHSMHSPHLLIQAGCG